MKPYYEGWYLKQQQGREFLAVIPGRAQDHSFIQVITQQRSFYLPFPLEAYARSRTEGPNEQMRIADNLFSPQGMHLNIVSPDVQLYGDIHYDRPHPLRYDIMGPFALLPMETQHTVFSMRHAAQGRVVLDGRELRFQNGIGYMEGDRGHSFPRGYTWIQSIDFSTDASVMLAVAEIPLGFIRFSGCIGVVLLHEHEYRFATYLGVRIQQATKSIIEITQRGMRLSIEVLDAEGHQLQAPVQGAMNRPIRESPAVPARFLFTNNGTTLLDEISPCTSFEHVPLTP